MSKISIVELILNHSLRTWSTPYWKNRFRQMLAANAYDERLANVFPNECSANAQWLFAEHLSCIHVSHANELSANEWRMFSECMANTHLHICILVFGDCMANVHRIFTENCQCHIAIWPTITYNYKTCIHKHWALHSFWTICYYLLKFRSGTSYYYCLCTWWPLQPDHHEGND